MKVSIIITSYNYERYLAATIDSALSQTWKDLEVIVLDDGSTDSSPEIMRRYEGRAKLIFQENGGHAAAFNVAYMHATGDAILFLDSDDVLEPHAIERMMAVWKPGMSKIHFPLDIIDETGKKSGGRVPRAALPEGDLLPQMLATGMYVSPPNSGNLFSRAFLDAVLPMPAEEWNYGPDCYLVFLAPFFGEVGAVQEPLGLYRRHAASITNITEADSAQLIRKLSSMLEADRRLRALLEEASHKRGLELSPEAVVSHWLHLKVRLSLHKIDTRETALPEGGPFRIAARLIRAVWRSDELSVRSRMEFTAWTMLVATLPPRSAAPLIRLAFAPGDRGRVLRQMVKRWA
ncbi:MAG: glycosyltransferase [Bryobacteraceae bacterium]